MSGARILLAAKGEVFKRCFARKYKGPVYLLYKPFELIWTLPCCIHSSHQSAQAISGEIVNGNVVLLKPSEHSDVGQSERTTPFESNTDGRPLGKLCSPLGKSDERRCHYGKQCHPDPQ